VSAQNNSINVYPWNPDSDNDNQIGVDDLQSFLTVYGNSFGLPPEPCDYEASSLEELVFGVYSGELVLDSIFIEYELESVSTYYEVGCPDPITDSLVFADAGFLYPGGNSCNWGQDETFFATSGIGLHLSFNTDISEGKYRILFTNNKINYLGFVEDGFFPYCSCYYTSEEQLPWPESWSLTENGISFPYGSCWSYANYIHILPYWHYADE